MLNPLELYKNLFYTRSEQLLRDVRIQRKYYDLSLKHKHVKLYRNRNVFDHCISVLVEQLL